MPTITDGKRVWIAWETQRRSLELAKILKCDLFVIEHEGFFRYPVSILKTFAFLIKSKPDKVFVQNPSMILTAFACIYCKILKKILIVDRHTTFLIDKGGKRSLCEKFFLLLSDITIRYADLTLVTNKSLETLVMKSKGKAFILPDPLPSLFPINRIKLGKFISIMIPSSFGCDEPIENIFNAAKILSENNFFFYITGNNNKISNIIKENLSSNVMFTGFLSDQDYIDLLYSVDVIMVLTTASDCMLCGCYEAIAAEKPLITSQKQSLQEYFYDAVFIDNSTDGIVNACIETTEHIDSYREKSQKMKTSISSKWMGLLNELEERLDRY
jgi:glycosyltransferase involved in cell wall biosynthesis